MTPQDPLSQLKDIHLPASQGWWPPAPGWWLLGLAALIALAAAVALWRRRRKRTLWRREARKALAVLESRATASDDWFAELNSLLKRAARQSYPSRHPETLSGTAWVEFLLDTGPGDTAANRPVVNAMVASTWQPRAYGNPTQAIAFARRWLESLP